MTGALKAVRLILAEHPGKGGARVKGASQADRLDRAEYPCKDALNAVRLDRAEYPGKDALIQAEFPWKGVHA